jgi:uncharacterized membrane protein
VGARGVTRPSKRYRVRAAGQRVRTFREFSDAQDAAYRAWRLQNEHADNDAPVIVELDCIAHGVSEAGRVAAAFTWTWHPSQTTPALPAADGTCACTGVHATGCPHAVTAASLAAAVCNTCGVNLDRLALES